MRKLLIPLMMASAMIPVAAAAKDRDGLADRIREHRAEKSEQSSQRNDNSQRSEPRRERQARPERVQRVERAEREQRVERRVQPTVQVRQRSLEAGTAQRVSRQRGGGFVNGIREVGRQQQDQDATQRDGRRDGDTRWSRDGRRDGDNRWSRDGRRDGDGRWSRDGRRDNVRWTSDWRRDHRYDWRNYRDRHRSIFRIGRYYDPYGRGYRRFSIGFNLSSNYYGSNYWLNDPWMYRLPPAYGPYRWVRYYDDALLVNIYTGQVVDVINNFFW